MTLARIFTVAALLFPSLAASAPASACGCSSGAEVGSDNCNGGATAGDRAAMAAQRAMNQH
ncbi:hypothetical protein FKO01_07155 [Mesorhizobium sp. B2-3-3]|uniref:hypothetical protein n=1 Tax=Mesorhizobium sp. B2-4-15 TaxID=2589934 RepID=UPI001151A280|nr:hypothetical protein [Mesorhizobium sp. B2-4-15]TPK72052.1 hypothetical protein FJ930_12775 [Mesorhizobium sp. B2-4-15]TPN37994.1 hypothetical protein FKO01_07155 [Mesorhizobium sp. B2-3-3]